MLTSLHTCPHKMHVHPFIGSINACHIIIPPSEICNFPFVKFVQPCFFLLSRFCYDPLLCLSPLPVRHLPPLCSCVTYNTAALGCWCNERSTMTLYSKPKHLSVRTRDAFIVDIPPCLSHFTTANCRTLLLFSSCCDLLRNLIIAVS